MMKKASVLCVVAVLMASAVAHGQTSALDKLPEGVVAVVESPNVMVLDQNVAEFLQQVSPGAAAPPLSMMLPAAAFKTQDPFSVNMQAPVRVVLLAPPRHMAPVLVYSVPDAARYLDSLVDSLEKQRDEGDVHVYSEWGRPVVIGTSGAQAALSNDVEAVKSVLGLIESGALPAGPLFGDCALGAGVRLKTLLDGLNTMGQNPFDMIRQSLPMAAGMGAQPGMDPEQGMKILMAELDAVESIAGQMDSLTITLALRGDAIVGTSQMRPVAGSGLSNYMASVPAQDLELLRYVPADSVAVWGTKLGDLGPLMNWYAGFMELLIPATGEGSPAAPLADLMRESASLVGGELAVGIAIGEQGRLTVYEAAAVKDPAAMEAMIEQSMQLVPDLMSAYEQMGMKMAFNVQRNALSYAGHDISKFEFDMQFTPVEGVPGAGQVAAMQQKMMDLMYGEEKSGYWTYLDSNLVYVQGDGALDALKQVIDGAIRPAAGSDRLAEATIGMPSGATSVGYVSLSGLANWGVGLAKAVVEEQMGQVPPELAAVEFGPSPPIGGATWIANGVEQTQWRIPVASVRVIAEGIQKAMTAPQPMMAPAAPQPMRAPAQ